MLSKDFQVEMSLYKEACLGFSPKTKDLFPAVKFKTVAVDFDGTISHLTTDLQQMGEPVLFVREALTEFARQGWQVIIYTVRPDTHSVKKFMVDNRLPFDAINCNPIDIDLSGIATMKPFAHLYIDDRCWPMCGKFAGWSVIMADLYHKGILDDAGYRGAK